ncbi:MAG: NAD(P)H-hydrate epimerase [Anaerolineales bacterium]|nr:NAD(P)H-hydrate epimerase [Anaerolineales bacterium]
MKNMPAVSREQMQEVDRLMIEEYRISLVQMMENAGRRLAELAGEKFFLDQLPGKKVLVLAGSGGNGGGGLTAARHLANWGSEVQVVLTRPPEKVASVTGQQLQILLAMKVPVFQSAKLEQLPEADLILDAVIGYSLSGPPYGESARLIRMANAHPAPRLSLDIPSGIDATAGVVHQVHIRADCTLTLALPKTGLLETRARAAVGELYAADISVPPDLYKHLGFARGPVFPRSGLIQLSGEDSEP